MFNLCTLQTVKRKITHTAYYMNTVKKRLTHFFLLDRKGRFDAIDGLKGYAVILVFLYHAAQYIEPFWGIHHNPYYLKGEKLFSFLLTRMPFIGTDGSCIGVDLFFILSGFLIYFILSKHTYTVLGFIKNRLQRLLPAHIVTLLAISLPYSPLVIGVNALFLQEFFPHVPKINLVTWTITYEFLFYIILSLFVTITKTWKRPTTWFLLLGITMLPWIGRFVLPQDYEQNGFSLFYLARFCVFFFGVALSKFYLEEQHLWKKVEKYIPILIIVSLGILAYWKNIWQPSYYRSWKMLYYIVLDCTLVVIVASVITQSSNILKKICAFLPLRILGSMSYSFYLVHVVIGIPIGLWVVQFIDYSSVLKIVLFLTSSFFITAGIATLVFHFFEKPYFAHKHTSSQKHSKNS